MTGPENLWSNYSPQVIDHFQNPRHVGEVENADGRGLIGDPDCGDFLEMTIRLSADHQMIEAVAYRIKGCPAAIATASIATELVKGKTVEAALGVTDQTIISAIGGLPEAKVHCSLLAVKALQAALQHALLKRLFLKSHLVASAAEFDQQWESGEIARRLGMPDHACDGTCTADPASCSPPPVTDHK
jgi:nitrogen fixation NifU-like protein